jgi:hypothetical protein
LAYPSRLLSRESLDDSPLAASDLRADDIEGSPSVDEDLDFARTTRSNLLVVGPDSLVMSIVRRMIADANGHLVIPCRHGSLSFARLATQPTIILRDVDALDADGQRVLFEWLDEAGAERQIVSTASAPLLPRVDGGVFDRGLYYRLNTVYIRLCD